MPAPITLPENGDANWGDTLNAAIVTVNGVKSADDITDGAVNKTFTAAEKTKLAGIATGATANSSDTILENRANHTGTQSADTIIDGTTNKAYSAADKTKLAGIAAGATANSTDATLENRANHTGTQLAATISDFSAAVDLRIGDKAPLASPTFTGNPTAPTPTSGDNDNSIATTAFVQTEISANLGGGGGGGGGNVQSVNSQTGAVVLTQDDVASGTTNKVYTATEKTKLAGIAAGATANSADSYLLSRANHTGTQTASTISDFASAVASQPALASRLNYRGAYAAGTTYSVNDVVTSPGSTDAVPVGAGTYRVLQNHTSAGAAPYYNNAYWALLGGTSSLTIGTAAGQVPDAAVVASEIAAKADVSALPTTDFAKALIASADVDTARGVLDMFVVDPGTDPSSYPAKSILFYLATASTVEPTRVGTNYQNGVPATGTTVTGTADSTLVIGSWMVAVYTGNDTMGAVTAPADWVVLVPRTTVNTLSVAVYGKIATSSDVGSKSFAFHSSANSALSTLMLLWGGGADVVTNWIVGTAETRATAGGTNLNIAPSVTTTKDKSLVLAISAERTAAADTAGPTHSGATLWVYGPESLSAQLQTTDVAYIDQTTAGATNSVTWTYQNVHATNGLAFQIVIPPASS